MIRQAILAEEDIDHKYAQRGLAELQRTEGYIRKYKTYSARIAASASLVAGAIGGIIGGVLGGLVGSALPVLLQEGTVTLVERKMRRNCAWIYFTSEEFRTGD